MQIESSPPKSPTKKPEGERRGIVIVNTGDGKGKSTAAFGLALRAHGRGKAVKIYQFMKVPSARFGEHRIFEKLGLPIEGPGRRLQLEEPGPASIRPSSRATAGRRPSAAILARRVLHGDARRDHVPAGLRLDFRSTRVLQARARRPCPRCMWC